MKQEEARKELQMLFQSRGITYTYATKKINLRKEIKQYLLPDFYLPKYEMYVEFMNGWEDPKQRPRCIEKLEIAERNNLPIVFVYPNDFKDLPHYFDLRWKQTAIKKQQAERQRRGEQFYNMLAVICFFLGIALLFYEMTFILGIISAGYGILLFFLRNYHEAGQSLVKMGHGIGKVFGFLGKGTRATARGVGTVTKKGGRGLFHLIRKAVTALFRLLIIMLKFLWAGTIVVLEYVWEGFLKVKEMIQQSKRGRRIKLRKR